MNSRTTRKFRELLALLPEDIQLQAFNSYRLFSSNPQHPSLRFKRIHAAQPIYSARVTLDYRAVGILTESGITWFWIGKHSDYEKLLASL